MFRLELSTDGAAFHDGDPGTEVARILRYAATRAEEWGGDLDAFHVQLRDRNGNTVGTAWAEDDT